MAITRLTNLPGHCSQYSGAAAFGVDDQPFVAGQHEVVDVGAAQAERIQATTAHLVEPVQVMEEVEVVGAAVQPLLRRSGFLPLVEGSPACVGAVLRGA
ncbi:hypothetical protein [Streptosporangium sp. KLBMP 9127]|nr:hypothetical protein [Streptosporangium sp. KLBMP 9127]